jgi:hypothetical protein
MRRVLVLGGLGHFGRTAVDELRRIGVRAMTASRRSEADLKIDANDASSIRQSVHKGDVVLDAAGSFHERSTALIEAAAEINFDIIDLNDDLGYAERVIALEPQIDAAGIRVLSSASSVSAVAAAVVRHSGIDLPVRVTAFLAPASRYTANVGSTESLWRSVGRPVRILADGALTTRVGWTETRPFTMPRPVGRISGHLFESADAVNLPRSWPSIRDVTMYVDSNTLGVNSLLTMAAHSEPLRELMQQKVEWGAWLAKKLGSPAGGIGYEIEAANGRVVRYAIVAAAKSFLTAVAPALIATRNIAADKFAADGLVPPDRQTEPSTLFEYLAQNDIRLAAIE